MAKGKKTGGRQPGSLNKDNLWQKQVKAGTVTYFTQRGKDGLTEFERDVADLSPEARVSAWLKLLNKSMADLKSIDANINSHNVSLTIEDRLRELCGDNDD